MVSNDSRVFDLQLFAEEDQQISDYFGAIDTEFKQRIEADIKKESAPEPEREEYREPIETQEREPVQERELVKEEEPVNTEPEPEPSNSGKVKFKENGQEVELTLDELIERAQKGSNYERKVQELATQRKAFELALEQSKNAPAPVNPADELANYQAEMDKFAAEFNHKYRQEFEPWNPVHLARFAEHRIEQREIQKSAEYQKQQEQHLEQRFMGVINELTSDRNSKDLNESAQKALFSLPQKGPEGIAEFNKLYPVYQKIQEREQYYAAVQQGYQPKQPTPFNEAEVTALQNFIGNVKKDYNAKKYAPPKSAAAKQPVQTERPGNGETTQVKPDWDKVSDLKGDDLDAFFEGVASKLLPRR